MKRLWHWFWTETWFRHPITLRVRWGAEAREKGVDILPLPRLRSTWDKGGHANVPLDLSIPIWRYTFHIAVVDYPLSEEGVPEWLSSQR